MGKFEIASELPRLDDANEMTVPRISESLLYPAEDCTFRIIFAVWNNLEFNWVDFELLILTWGFMNWGLARPLSSESTLFQFPFSSSLWFSSFGFVSWVEDGFVSESLS